MKITYSAPGSIIIAGEQGKIYGKPVLACAIDMQVTCTITPSSHKQTDPSTEVIEQYVQKYLNKNDIDFEDKTYRLHIDSELPEKEQFGYMSTRTCVIIACLLHFYTGRVYDKEVVNRLAYAIIKKQKKQFDGITTTAACFGGIIYFRKEFEFLKSVSVLPAKIPPHIEEKLYIIETIENTNHYIFDLYKKDPSEADRILQVLEKCIKKLVVAIMKEDLDLFKKTIDDIAMHKEFNISFSLSKTSLPFKQHTDGLTLS